MPPASSSRIISCSVVSTRTHARTVPLASVGMGRRGVRPAGDGFRHPGGRLRFPMQTVTGSLYGHARMEAGPHPPQLAWGSGAHRPGTSATSHQLTERPSPAHANCCRVPVQTRSRVAFTAPCTVAHRSRTIRLHAFACLPRMPRDPSAEQPGDARRFESTWNIAARSSATPLSCTPLSCTRPRRTSWTSSG